MQSTHAFLFPPRKLLVFELLYLHISRKIPWTRYATAICFVNDGKLFSSGFNYYGQLGLEVNGQGTNKKQLTHAPSGFFQDGTLYDSGLLYSKVAAGSQYSLAIDNSGVLFAAGGNTHGALGLGNQISKDKFTVKRSNLLKIDYPDNYFDFVHCAGAVHHTVDYKKSIKELCRVTKKGGMMYLEYYGKGGIVQEVVDFLRKKYSLILFKIFFFVNNITGNK